MFFYPFWELLIQTECGLQKEGNHLLFLYDDCIDEWSADASKYKHVAESETGL